ncbi:hypothetical protein CHUAL_009148 [Chamberlinius hualienensis]
MDVQFQKLSESMNEIKLTFDSKLAKLEDENVNLRKEIDILHKGLDISNKTLKSMVVEMDDILNNNLKCGEGFELLIVGDFNSQIGGLQNIFDVNGLDFGSERNLSGERVIRWNY